MRANQFDTAETSTLVDEFAAAAETRGAAVLDSLTRRANRMYDRMAAVDSALRSRGHEARLALIPLLDDESRFVRYYAAIYLLGLVPDRARAEIEWNAKYRFDAIAGDANGLLRAFDTGDYRAD